MAGSSELASSLGPYFKDGVSALKFSPKNPDLLLAANWDNSVSIFDITSKTPRLMVMTHAGPALCCAWDTVIYSRLKHLIT